MDLKEVINRTENPEPWAEGDNIPWNDPGFSKRMLSEHLSQNHDMASRRVLTIDRQLDWIKKKFLPIAGSKVLDLGCGPGFYTSKLAADGFICVGIDYSPASIEYATRYALENNLGNCQYSCQDVRDADFGCDFDLIIMIFGEINVFRPSEAISLLSRAHDALKSGGTILIEAHTFDAVKKSGEKPDTWFSASASLFSGTPHITLMDSRWQETSATAVHRYYVISEDGHVNKMSSTIQAYTDEQYRSLLKEGGFNQVETAPSLAQEDFVFYSASL